jgi:hypothetical protein
MDKIFVNIILPILGCFSFYRATFHSSKLVYPTLFMVIYGYFQVVLVIFGYFNLFHLRLFCTMLCFFWLL